MQLLLKLWYWKICKRNLWKGHSWMSTTLFRKMWPVRGDSDLVWETYMNTWIQRTIRFPGFFFSSICLDKFFGSDTPATPLWYFVLSNPVVLASLVLFVPAKVGKSESVRRIVSWEGFLLPMIPQLSQLLHLILHFYKFYLYSVLVPPHIPVSIGTTTNLEKEKEEGKRRVKES